MFGSSTELDQALYAKVKRYAELAGYSSVDAQADRHRGRIPAQRDPSARLGRELAGAVRRGHLPIGSQRTR